MEGDEVGIAFLHNERAEGQTQSDVVECIRLFVGGSREACARDGKLERWGHGCGSLD